jgi:hypothetical protein
LQGLYDHVIDKYGTASKTFIDSYRSEGGKGGAYEALYEDLSVFPNWMDLVEKLGDGIRSREGFRALNFDGTGCNGTSYFTTLY